MKCVTLISKDTDLADKLLVYFRTAGFGVFQNEDGLSFNFRSPKGCFIGFMVINNSHLGFFDPLPPDKTNEGYKYSLVVECQDIDFLCKVLKMVPEDLGFLVVDDDENYLTKEEIDPQTLVL